MIEVGAYSPLSFKQLPTSSGPLEALLPEFLSFFTYKTGKVSLYFGNLILVSYIVSEKTASPARSTIGAPREVDHHVSYFWNVR